MSGKWVRFKKRFNYVPAKASAMTYQYDAGAIDSLNEEAFAKAVPKFAEEIEAPANAEAAAALKSGETEPTLVTTADAPSPAPAARTPRSKAN